MRICFVCNEYPPFRHGGIGSAVQNFARELAKDGNQVRVVGAYNLKNSLAENEIDAGVQVYRLKESRIPKIGWLKARYDVYTRIERWAERGDIDLVEVPDFEGWNAGWARLPVPVVIRLQGSASYFAHEAGKEPGRLMYFIERKALREADFHCSSSVYAAELTRRVFGLNGLEMSVLYNAVEVSEVSPAWSPSGQRVVFTGTLTPKKGVLSLISAWKAVHESLPKAELHVYGKDGRTDAGTSMRDHLLSLLSADEKSSVFFHGHVPHDQIGGILRCASAAVFPSYAEAFSLAPLEAMAQGCPTICSRRSSGPELVTPEKDGLLVDPDNINEISGALIRLLTEPELAVRLAAAGWLRVKTHFSTAAVLDKNLEFYQQCLVRFSSRTRAVVRH